MKLEEKILEALRLAIKKADGKSNLAAQRKTAYSIVNRFENGQCKIKNMTISTLEKLFPQVEIIFFPTNNSTSYSAIDVSDQSDRSEESDNGVRQDALTRALQKAEAKQAEYERKLAELERTKADLEKDRRLFEQEKEILNLKLENEKLKNEGAARLFER